MAHPWKLDPHLLKVPPPGVIQFADLYIIFDPKKTTTENAARIVGNAWPL
jgi:hypothetical protein